MRWTFLTLAIRLSRYLIHLRTFHYWLLYVPISTWSHSVSLSFSPTHTYTHSHPYISIIWSYLSHVYLIRKSARPPKLVLTKSLPWPHAPGAPSESAPCCRSMDRFHSFWRLSRSFRIESVSGWSGGCSHGAVSIQKLHWHGNGDEWLTKACCRLVNVLVFGFSLRDSN